MSDIVRVATADDIAHVVNHRERMFREMGTECDYEAMAAACTRWYAETLPTGIYRGWIAERDRRVIGGAGMIVVPWSPGPSCLDPRMGWIYNVFVEPDHRGRGVARRLVEAIHAWCRGQGIERLALNATEAGAGVYRGLGYSSVPEPMMRLDLQ